MTTEDFAERLFGTLTQATEALAIALGDQLGWYRALAGQPRTAPELATTTGTAVRYATEWLEHQTATGVLTVDDPARPSDQRVYTLPAEHEGPLTDPDSLAYLAPAFRMVAAAGGRFDDLVSAYRTGGGVSWQRFGDPMRTGQADMNRPFYLQELGAHWLPSIPSVHAALTDGGRVADVGCGEGWSSIGIALAYPAATVDGFDLDAASVAAARRNAEEHGVHDRVTFAAVDAGTVGGGTYDLVTAFECIHDMPDPVAALTAMRALAGDDGVTIVMDERVGEQFAGAATDDVEKLMYGFSLLICLPDGLSHQPSVGTGTVMRPATLRAYAEQAGYAGIEILPIENDLWRFYRLRP